MRIAVFHASRDPWSVPLPGADKAAPGSVCFTIRAGSACRKNNALTFQAPPTM
jgi:hypothetical protein